MALQCHATHINESCRIYERVMSHIQGPNGGVSATRYAYVGGFDGTSNALAGMMFGMKVCLCCGVLQRVAVYCGVMRCVAVWCSVLWCVAVCCGVLQCLAVCCSFDGASNALAGMIFENLLVLQCVAICCGVLHVLRCAAVCCGVYRCVPVCTGVLQMC